MMKIRINFYFSNVPNVNSVKSKRNKKRIDFYLKIEKVKVFKIEIEMFFKKIKYNFTFCLQLK